VDDRLTPGLYLEMVAGPVADHVAHRVPEVLALPGVTRASWWRNVHRDRDDLPRRLPEFDHLVVYELTDEFVPPAGLDGVGALHYRRTPRPGQGRLTGRPTRGISLVLISPRHPAEARALRDWGDFVHLRFIAEVAVPGYSIITPYEHATGGEPRFLHFYEMDTDDPETAYRAMTPLVTELLGGRDTPEWEAWATHPALRIMYVNNFVYVGERLP
jgi:hypothetical protein